MTIVETLKVASHPLETLVKAGGVVGLIAVMGMGFLMFVIYSGQQQIIQGQKDGNDILSDIRYDIKASRGVTFRNNPPQ